MILPFDKISKNDANKAGGKGASLGEMTQAGIAIPPGFVVLSETFEEFVDSNNLRAEIQTILGELDHNNVGSIEHASEKIQELIRGGIISETIQKEIQKYTKTIKTDFVAVRSSATAEDGAEHAWAGQLDTYLNVPKTDIITRIQSCWASLFTPRALFYRSEKGLRDLHISVAVVVQSMVDAESAGVAFSVHPVTENTDEIVIEGSWGLGEAVVSGEVTPDSFVISKSSGEIISQHIAEKKKGIFRNINGENEWRNIEKHEQQISILSKNKLSELAKLIIKIENHYGFPCDIEWAFSGGKFYILQARPITTLHTDKSAKARPISEKISKYNWEHRVSRPGFYQSKQIVSEAVCQKIQLTRNIEIHDINNIWINNINLYDANFHKYLSEELFPKAFFEDKNWVLGILKEFKQHTSEKDIFVDFMESHSWAQNSSKEKINAMMNYVSLLKNIQKYYALAVPLTNYCESVLSSENPSLLNYAWQYMDLDIDAMNQSFEYIQNLPKNETENALIKHVKKFRWIKTNYNIIDPYTIDNALAEIGTIVHTNKRKKIPKTQLQHIGIALQIGIYLRNRMKELSQQIWFAFDELAQQGARDFCITREDFLQLSYTEVCNSWRLGKLVVKKEEINARKKSFIVGIFEGNSVAIAGDDARIEKFYNSKEHIDENIKGFCAYAGTVRGTVKIVKDIGDAKKLKKDDILVTHMTTPDFVIIMKQAGAIITDEGGLSCHAAITARELKIPCIIGTKNATKILKDGDLVEVDAENGVVNILNK